MFFLLSSVSVTCALVLLDLLFHLRRTKFDDAVASLHLLESLAEFVPRLCPAFLGFLRGANPVLLLLDPLVFREVPVPLGVEESL